MKEMEQVIVEERQQLKVDGFVKTGYHIPHMSIMLPAVPLKGKLDWTISSLCLYLLF